MQFGGAFRRDGFDVFVTEALVPTLRAGDMAVPDNLPVQFPDVNLIEQAFSETGSHNH